MKTRIVIFVLVPAAVAFVAVWFFAGGPSGAEIRNVILISIDTCRADHLGCYGYPKKITPNIDAIAKKSALFENAIAPTPITLPSHTTMLAGTTPLYHQVHDNATYYVAEYNRTIAQILSEHGYRTGAIVSAAVLDSAYGLDRGFETYQDEMGPGPAGSKPATRKGGATTRLAVKWLEEHKDEKFFLFLHYFDPHFPYEPPAPFSLLFRDNLYAGEVAYTDNCVGQVIEKLKELGLYDSTLLIITADHGEMLGEHSEITHGFFIYQGALRVPLIMRIPGHNKPARVRDRVGLVDIAPAICSLLGIDIPDAMQGKDLSGCLGRKTTSTGERYFYCESLWPTIYGCNPLLGIVAGRYKYIHTTRPELYDLLADPQEQHNMIDTDPKRAHLMHEHLKLKLDELVYRVSSDSNIAIDEKTLRSIESLGYLAAAHVDDSFEFDETREDAKDVIDFHRANMAIRPLIIARKFEQAKTLCHEMLSQRPQHLQTYVYLGSIALEQGDNEEVINNHLKYIEVVDPNWQEPNRPQRQHLELALQNPPLKKTHLELTMAYYKLGRLEQAQSHARTALKLSPASRQAHNVLGIILMRLGHSQEAIPHFQETLRLGLEAFDVHYNLAMVLQDQGKLDEAAGHYRQCLSFNRAVEAPVSFRLGQLSYEKGDAAAAAEYMSRALELAPNRPEVLDGLALIYTTGRGQFDDPNRAVALAQKACEVTRYETASYVRTLAAAYAAAGRTDKAIETAEKAMTLARTAGDTNLATELKKELEQLRKSRP